MIHLKTSSLRVGESVSIPREGGELVIRLHECGRGEFEASVELPPGEKILADVDENDNLVFRNEDSKSVVARIYIRRQNVSGQVSAPQGSTIHRIAGGEHTL